MDMNLICNTDVSMPGQPGTCECRRDMRWNADGGECQFYMDVDCSSVTYDTPASAGVLAAVSRAQAAQAGGVDFVDAAGLGRTETMQESLQNSLLRHVDPKTASEAEMREAFCRWTIRTITVTNATIVFTATINIIVIILPCNSSVSI